MPVICLTGGIASGKSTASRFLAERGAYVIDADLLGHKVYEPGSDGIKAVVGVFGEEVVAADGSIDRKALGAKVFGKPEALKQLTDVVWPEIRKLAEQEIKAELAKGNELIVLEAAVLFEAGWQDLGDQIWVVTVEPEIAIERAMARDGLAREAVEARIASQLSNEERAAQAHKVLDNSGDPDAFSALLDLAWQDLAPSV